MITGGSSSDGPFESFYRREYAATVAIARELLGSGAPAEDLAQECFVATCSRASGAATTRASRSGRPQGEGSLRVLIQLLGTRHALQEIEGEPDIYVWPAAFTYDSWEEIPEEDLAELTAIFGEEEMELIAGFGSYAGWRVGITEDGDWRFFIAGD